MIEFTSFNSSLNLSNNLPKQGYSLTESTCSGTVMENSELTTDTAGKPMAGIEARLVDWDEGEYKVTDRPRPRGEILLAGEPIAKVQYLHKKYSSLTLDNLVIIFISYHFQMFIIFCRDILVRMGK